MAIVRAQVTIPSVSGQAADAATNTWHFDVGSSFPAGLDEIVPALKAFYDAWSGLRSPQMTWSQASVKFYDLALPKPSGPVWSAPLGLTSAAGTDSMPLEVSICLSFKHIDIPGVPLSSTRGRVYLGPLCRATTLGTDGRVATTAQNTLRDAGQALELASDSSTEFSWVIYSPTRGQMFSVSSGWVDNEFDTQRRRGRRPTARASWT